MIQRQRKCGEKVLDSSCKAAPSTNQLNAPKNEEGEENEAGLSSTVKAPKRSDRSEQLIKNLTYRSSVLVQSWSATVRRAVGHHGSNVAPKTEAAVQVMSRSAWMASRLLHGFVSAHPHDADKLVEDAGPSDTIKAALTLVQKGELLRSQAVAGPLDAYFRNEFAPCVQ